MYELALTLAIILGHPHVDRSIIRAAAAAVEEDPTPIGGSPADELAIVLVWASKESGMQQFPKAMSKDAKHGVSHGLLQQRLVLPVREQFSVWLSNLHLARKMCGSDEGGLRMISSGHCDRAYGLVRDRLEEAWVALELAAP
jgi:hypothetical protein